MGQYTLLQCDVTFKEGTPADILSALSVLTDPDEYRKELPFVVNLPRFFQCERVKSLFFCSSAYFARSDQGVCEFGKNEAGSYRLQIKSSLKNYDDEIYHFKEWIKPYLQSGEISSHYEEDEEGQVLWPEGI